MPKELIARYEIQSEIGRGGMATVYLAHDPNFRRKVAIKLVSTNLQSDHMYRERFEREAHLIAKIEHPAIVPVYDYGEHENDLYLVMRYMPGGSLGEKIKAGILTLRDAAQVISQIAPALDAVHAQGIVHRDLKPGNILFDSFDNPAISDFGIAHFTAATSDLTGSAIIGTPSYMSPEQVRGESLDGRSDLYALGVTLFEMLAGHGPFQSMTPLSVAFKHLTDPIPSICLFRPDLPAQVENVLNKALAKERDERYSTASELARDLRAIADTFQEGEVPRLIRPLDGRDAVTEMDTSEDSQPAVDVPSTPYSDIHRHPISQVPSQGSIARPSSPGKPAKRFSLRPLQLVVIAGVGLFLFFLCGSFGVFGTWAGLRGLFSPQTPTLPPTSTATQTSNVQDTVLFADDFSDPNSGWPAGQNDQGTYGYQLDGYHILVTGNNQVLWASTERVHDDTSIYVDAVPLTGSNGYYGLLCRLQDNQNFYYFVIQGDGSYTIGKYKDSQFGSFFPEGWRQSDAIPTDQSNRLQADCTGSTLRLFVNNVLIGEATDTDLSSGFSGLVAATLGDQDFEVRFNNFLVTEAVQ